MTVEEAAQELGMRPGAVRNAIIAGRIKAHKFSPRVLLISRAEVERYKANRPKPGPRPRKERPDA